MNFVGQNKEDELISNYFIQKISDKFQGNILDIGANDGITLSNSYYMIQNGWAGYLVEAGKTPFAKMKSLHEGNNKAHLYNVALGNTNGVMTFYESKNMLEANDVGLVSSLIPDETKRWRDSGVLYDEYKVEVFDFNTFLINNGLTETTFDFISIDIEGMDYDVLVQINLSKVGCKCLCIEFNGIDSEKYISYANQHGLKLAYTNAENLIFTK
jgi:FkbM family methyltransferase